MSFIHDDFLLTTPAARKLFHAYARDEPILDYHTHLSPREIAENRRYANLAEMWLEGDHYKWRAMRAAGVHERLLTGDAPAKEKFFAWARTVPQTLRNPLYHWTHLELKRYFNIDTLLDATTAEEVWKTANRRLEDEEFSTQSILRKFHVTAVCTTDDPADDLAYHRAIADSDFDVRVFPTFRPDAALKIDQPEVFNAWVERLQGTSNVSIGSLVELCTALRRRHDAFHQLGGRASDHGLERIPTAECTEREAAAIFNKVRGGTAATGDEWLKFASYLMLYFGHLDAEKGWTKQLHLGVIRNNSTRLYKQLGPDVGLDSMSDIPQAVALRDYFDALDRENALPKTIVYNLNPADNYLFATMIANFNDGSAPGKMQYGSGWWYLDTRAGIEWQLNTLSNCGLLSRFVGMLTDSRSFMSFPRHEYFRRVLCDVVGRDIAACILPDAEFVGEMIRHICYANAREYLALPVGDAWHEHPVSSSNGRDAAWDN
jgi:glucuronate isomerase